MMCFRSKSLWSLGPPLSICPSVHSCFRQPANNMTSVNSWSLGSWSFLSETGIRGRIVVIEWLALSELYHHVLFSKHSLTLISQDIGFCSLSLTVVFLSKSGPGLSLPQRLITWQRIPGMESVYSTTEYQANVWPLSGMFCPDSIYFSYILPQNIIVKSVCSGHLSSRVLFSVGNIFLLGSHLPPAPWHTFCLCGWGL
jgi:hypothetical protein